MVKFLQSTWASMLLGGLLFFGTTAALLKPSQLPVMSDAGAQEIIHVVNNEPSWKVHNPEMDQWIQEIKREKDALAKREQQLGELETRVSAERQELSAVTQAVSQMQADFDDVRAREPDEELEDSELSDHERQQAIAREKWRREGRG